MVIYLKTKCLLKMAAIFKEKSHSLPGCFTPEKKNSRCQRSQSQCGRFGVDDYIILTLWGIAQRFLGLPPGILSLYRLSYLYSRFLSYLKLLIQNHLFSNLEIRTLLPLKNQSLNVV
jgi:hypothetical protein